MGTIELMELIERLPTDKKKGGGKIGFDLSIEVNQAVNVASDENTTMKFGDLKGFVTYIADDFDEPLEDLKDYM